MDDLTSMTEAYDESEWLMTVSEVRGVLGCIGHRSR